MSFFGMGTLEILVVLLLAFILLGPNRMVDAARLLGRATREVRRLADELPSDVLHTDRLYPDRDAPSGVSSGEIDRPDGRSGTNEDGPVAFQQSNDEDLEEVEPPKKQTT